MVLFLHLLRVYVCLKSLVGELIFLMLPRGIYPPTLPTRLLHLTLFYPRCRISLTVLDRSTSLLHVLDFLLPLLSALYSHTCPCYPERRPFHHRVPSRPRLLPVRLRTERRLRRHTLSSRDLRSFLVNGYMTPRMSVPRLVGGRQSMIDWGQDVAGPGPWLPICRYGGQAQGGTHCGQSGWLAWTNS